MDGKGYVMGAGSLALVGSFKEAGGFPSNGYAIIGATVALVFLVSLTGGTTIDRPVKALAGLMLLGAAYRYVPAFTTSATKKKG